MSKKYLTLMVIPHNEDRIRELNVSRPFLWGLSTLLVLSLCALVFYTIGYYIQLNREVRLATLQTENEELKVQFERVQRMLKTFQGQVDELTQTDRMMRAWASFSEPGEDIRKVGVGGISEETSLWESRLSFETEALVSQTYASLDQLVREASFLKTSFDSVASFLENDAEARSHMPTILPVSADYECWYSSGFGYRPDPFTGRRHFHNGLDIAGRRGTPILAAADGVIANVAFDKHLGYYVAITHGSGLRTVYGHLQRNSSPLKKGQKVKRGEVIGKMGKSGRATAPHLHYSVSRNKKAIDPKLYIFDQRKLSSIY